MIKNKEYNPYESGLPLILIKAPTFLQVLANQIDNGEIEASDSLLRAMDQATELGLDIKFKGGNLNESNR